MKIKYQIFLLTNQDSNRSGYDLKVINKVYTTVFKDSISTCVMPLIFDTYNEAEQYLISDEIKENLTFLSLDLKNKFYKLIIQQIYSIEL